MRKILVTGGAGFIGYHLVNKLSSREDVQIDIADNLQRGRMDRYFEELLGKPNVEFHQVDLTDKSTMKPIQKTYDDVYYLAAMVGVKHCMNQPERVLNLNIVSTINMIDLVKETNSKRLLFSSTCENYASGFGLGVIPLPSPEDVPLVVNDIKNPRLSYAGSKIVGEQMVHHNAQNADGHCYDYSIVRYHNVYGPRMGFAHVIPEVVNRVYQKESPFRLFGADQTRAFCFVDDAVEQTILAMEHPETKNEILHIGNSGEERKISDLIKSIFSILDYNPEINEVAPPEGSVNRRCPDTSKMARLTGFKPTVSLEEGLKKTVSWYWEEVQQGGVWE